MKAAALIREHAGAVVLAAIAALLPLAVAPSLLDPRTSQRFALQVAVLATGAVAAAIALRSRREALRLAPVELAAVAFGAWTFLACALSKTPTASMLEAMSTLTGLAAFLLFRRFAARETPFRIVVAGFAAAALLVAGVGIAQRFGVDVLDYQATEREGKLRILSLLGNPNYVASFLAPVAFVVAALGASLRKPALRFVALAASAPVVGCLAIAGGRAGILGFAVGFGALGIGLLAMHARARRVSPRAVGLVIAGLAVSMALALGFAGRGLRERALSSDSVYVRLLPWHVASRMVAANPIVGVGEGRYFADGRDAMFDFLKSEPDARLYHFEMQLARGGAPDHLHNEYLQILVETGVPGVFLFLAIVCLAAGEALRRALAGDAAATCLLAALVAHLVDACFGFPFRLPASSLLFWFVLAACSGSADARGVRVPGGGARVALSLATCALLALATAMSARQADGFRLRVTVARRSSLLGGDPLMQRRVEEAWLLAPFVDPEPYALVNTHVERGNHDRAFALLAEMEEYLYMGGAGYRQMAAEAWTLGRREEAARCLDRATTLDPFDADAFEYAAVVAIEQGRLDEAESLLCDATRRNPARPNAYYLLGTISESRGSRAEAASRYESALRALNGYGGTLLFARAEAENRLNKVRQ